MNSKNVKVGVIGVGKMGEYHLQKYLKAPKTQCVGVYDPNKQRAAEIKEKYGVKVFNNLAECLFEVDAVTVASPTATHYLISKQALTSGVNVLVENHIANTIPRARELVKLSKDLGLILQV